MGRALLLFLLAAGLYGQGTRQIWTSVADRLIQTDPRTHPWDWGEGVMMSGLMQTYARTNHAPDADFVAKWIAFHSARGMDYLLAKNPGAPRPGYCGKWVCGTAAAYLYEARHQPEHLEIASTMAQFIRAGATRSPDGVPGHWLGNYQIWVDTLNMSCPLLARLSKIENRPSYLDDAAQQLLSAARVLEDPQNGLFFHMYDWQKEKRSPVQWGRGNGWIIMSIADVMEYLPKDHRLYADLTALALRHAESLAKVQDSDGLWKTVITDSTSYAECSATTMITYGYLKLVRLGVLPATYRDRALKAWQAVNARFVTDGLVIGVSAGTDPSTTEGYQQKGLGNYPWGTGAYLMAGAEVDRISGNKPSAASKIP